MGNEFVFIQGVRCERFESYLFEAYDGGYVCIELQDGVGVMKVLVDGSWIPYYSGKDVDCYQFLWLLERGRTRCN